VTGGANVSVAVRRRTVNGLLIIVLAYFKLGLITLVLMGVDPATIYYSSYDYSLFDKLVVLSLNLAYVGLAAFMLHRLMPKVFLVAVYSHWVLIAAAVAFVFLENTGNLELSRADIKENATALGALSSVVAYSYLSAIILCERNRPKFYAAVAALVFAIVMSYEREVILFLFIPLMLRWDRGSAALVKMGAVFALSVIVLTGYKYAASLVRGDVTSSSASEFWEFVQLSLLRDNIHTGILELSYFSGRSPDYNNLSYFIPVQIERMFHASALTNGQMASFYYTGGRTGTGFSALLEAWLNFGPVGVLVLPLLLALGMRRVALAGSAFLFIAATIFVFKLQRSDLWPAVLAYLLAPLVVFVIVGIMRNVGRMRRRPA
jgi:hypothetical protein